MFFSCNFWTLICEPSPSSWSPSSSKTVNPPTPGHSRNTVPEWSHNQAQHKHCRRTYVCWYQRTGILSRSNVLFRLLGYRCSPSCRAREGSAFLRSETVGVLGGRSWHHRMWGDNSGHGATTTGYLVALQRWKLIKSVTEGKWSNTHLCIICNERLRVVPLILNGKINCARLQTTNYNSYL